MNLTLRYLRKGTWPEVQRPRGNAVNYNNQMPDRRSEGLMWQEVPTCKETIILYLTQWICLSRLGHKSFAVCNLILVRAIPPVLDGAAHMTAPLPVGVANIVSKFKRSYPLQKYKSLVDQAIVPQATVLFHLLNPNKWELGPKPKHSNQIYLIILSLVAHLALTL